MGLITLQMFTSWSPTIRSLFKLENSYSKIGIKGVEYVKNEGLLHIYFEKLENSYSTIGIKGVEYVKKEGLLHIYFEKFSGTSKQFLVDVVQDMDLKVYNAEKAYIRAVEYYDTGVTTAKSYRIKTTCRGKLKKKTKACITTWKIPPNFRSAVCNAAAVYTTLAGREKDRPIILLQNLRPVKTETKLKHFVFPRLPPGCECSLFSKDGGPRQVMIVTHSTFYRKYLTLDQYSIIMRNSRKARAEARAAQETCPF
ncbi:alpha-2-macroglobulin-like protein [Plakobranchus ocellatus]|uniref:Alpha-2-macroglobulin-like protein n=1 Tax=Plakobranchus ocellatus TaxID=259542 RepID=A0AAV4BFR8_9GAST|nr:alpha-2-macroglobulin-like protein [Plakobranchus ocellatus]